jgi:hypothetical protein
MEKDIDRIQKNPETDIVIRIDDFNGRKGVTIREFVKSERYTGFTKAGTRIPADKFHLFKKAINSINEKDLEGEATFESAPAYKPQQSSFKPDTKKAPVKKAKEESFDEVEF